MNQVRPSFQLVTPRSVREQVCFLGGLEAETPSRTWAEDARLLALWLIVWITLLLGAALSPLVVLIQFLLKERRWRAAVIFLFIVPAAALGVLIAVFAAGMGGLGGIK
jgi:hypothetical protein